jgi:hypothetical protein
VISICRQVRVFHVKQLHATLLFLVAKSKYPQTAVIYLPKSPLCFAWRIEEENLTINVDGPAYVESPVSRET